jgi:predicted  nucleic acid-binding Zn-ribbon protein
VAAVPSDAIAAIAPSMGLRYNARPDRFRPIESEEGAQGMAKNKLLHELQKVDSTSDAVAAKLKRVELALRGDKALRTARADSEAREAALAEVTSRLSRSRQERDQVRERHGVDSQSLYSGKAKSAREVQNLQKEVESLGRRLASLDDALLGIMLEQDEARAALADARSLVEAAAERQRGQQAALSAERDKLMAAQQILKAQGARLRSASDAESLAIYDRLRASKNGRAVAELRGSSCSGCGVELPAEEIQRVRTEGTRLLYCRGCGRILHG